MTSSNTAEYKFNLKSGVIKFQFIITGFDKRSRLPRRQTLAVGSFPLESAVSRDQRIKAYRLCISTKLVVFTRDRACNAREEKREKQVYINLLLLF